MTAASGVCFRILVYYGSYVGARIGMVEVSMHDVENFAVCYPYSGSSEPIEDYKLIGALRAAFSFQFTMWVVIFCRIDIECSQFSMHDDQRVRLHVCIFKK